ncbi:amino acid permease [Alloscardovia theropitheci]|uniref:Amino acid permease n=1 Tax=Alloscardovia theropitheci TaxID=2496842 RepID=A0A4R0QVG7_9BIFI|nr:amino acid permease [Alloscardovia theropitheci]TCD54177.1 amino acid permease [Alloscardovia theropitheci]
MTENSTEPAEVSAAAQSAADTQAPQEKLTKGLQNRHIQLIALGGAIGTGLFYGSAESIKLAGPSILLTYLLGGAIIFLIVRALGEMSTYDPKAGAFSYYASHYWSKRAGFVSGWNYWANYVLVSMVELAVVGQFVQYWFPTIPAWLSAIVFMVLITAANMLGVKAFGEFEFWFAIIKIVAVIAMIVLGLVVIVMAIPGADGIVPGIHNLANFAPHGFFSSTAQSDATASAGVTGGVTYSGILMALVVVMFSFGGTELIGITAGEAEDPKTSIPKATNEVVWRILIFYVAALAVIMCVVPWDKIGVPNAQGVVVSPFVQIFDSVGIHFAAGLLNFVCLTAVISVYNSALYSNSRMLYSLSIQGNAPRYLSKTNKRGVPAWGVLTSAAITVIAVVVVFLWPEFAFNYLMSIATFSGIFNWSMIAITQMKFRKNIGAEGEKELTFKLPFAKITPWIILAAMLLIYALMWLSPSYRIATWLGPLWVVVLVAAYEITQRVKKK